VSVFSPVSFMLFLSIFIGLPLLLFTLTPWYRKQQARTYARQIVLPALQTPEVRAEIVKIVAEAARKQREGK
jgi:hypothetical protein